ncbi:MAG: DeoR family transcriptional regulator [Algicola sp.]|nr:DeoR family transcriptional regulator [Algicola sp.]
MMNSIQRRHDIVQTALKTGKVLVPDLVDKYAVSAVTIRSDLNQLASKGLLVRARGGALANNAVSLELSIDQKHQNRQHIKRKLAQAVCTLINEGEAIILDSGTTTAEVATCLHQFNRLVVMTNGLNVAQNLVNAGRIEVLMTGGTLRNKSLSFYGRQAEESLQRYHFDKVILGVDGFDFHAGITTHFEYEAIMNRLMCDVAQQVIVVTDSSKFNRCGVHKIRGFDQINALVTDSGIPDSFAQSLEQAGVKLVIVED